MMCMFELILYTGLPLNANPNLVFGRSTRRRVAVYVFFRLQAAG